VEHPDVADTRLAKAAIFASVLLCCSFSPDVWAAYEFFKQTLSSSPRGSANAAIFDRFQHMMRPYFQEQLVREVMQMLQE